MDFCEYQAARGRLFLVVLSAHLAVAVGLLFAGFSVDYGSFVPGYAIVTILIAAAVAAMAFRATRTVAALDVAIAGAFAITPCVIVTYLALSLGFPLADDRLMAWDAAIGFDWRAFVAFVDRWPLLAHALDAAYDSFFLQMFLIPVVLAARGHGMRAASMVTAQIVLCFAAALVAIAFPSVGAYAAYGVEPADVINIDPKYGFLFLEQFHALRGSADFVLSESRAAGIVTFPSVHAGAAAVFLWGAWRDPWMRYPALIVNVAMAVSALSHGSHYLIDVLAGIAIAVVAILASTQLFARCREADVQSTGLAAPDMLPA